MEKQLFILPFDHRKSFVKDLLGCEKKPDKEQSKKISDLKQIIYEAFLKTRAGHLDKNNFGILVDWQFGSKIIKDAKKNCITTCVPVEKSGQDLFDFEYGKKFGEYIKKANPDYVKVLVRYNPENIQDNKIQLKKLKDLSVFCKKNNFKLIFELLVPPTETDLKICKNYEGYDANVRPQKTAQAIKEIVKEVDVAVWKLEGAKIEQWKGIVSCIKRGSKIIILGRAGSKTKVKKWLKDAIQFKEIIGFAVGRTIFFESLKSYLSKEISREEAIDIIAKDFNYFIKTWHIQRNN